MKTLIIYASNYGFCKKCVDLLKEKIKGTDVRNIKESGDIDIENYDTVIIGGSIRIGRINKGLSRFCKNHLETLLKKKTGLFICCMNEEDIASDYFTRAFPIELQKHAIAKGYFGGELDFDKMSQIETSLIKNIIDINKNVSLIKLEKIEEFAATILKNL